VSSTEKHPTKKEVVTSCGTLLINSRGEILLCHATGTNRWDIPKGLPDPGESPLQAAKRELWEETSLDFDEALFDDIGCYDYRKSKRLHLFKMAVPDSLDSLEHLYCSSNFPHRITGKPIPEMDSYRWATRSEIKLLCTPRMAERLLSLDWSIVKKST
jgi:putative (di)nucleoside polyphosphate hydrolase